MKRAPIVRIGKCEPVGEEHWYATNWQFDGKQYEPQVPGCPMFTHDDQGVHIGLCGWTWEDLKAISDAQVELSMLPVADSPS